MFGLPVPSLGNPMTCEGQAQDVPRIAANMKCTSLSVNVHETSLTQFVWAATAMGYVRYWMAGSKISQEFWLNIDQHGLVAIATEFKRSMFPSAHCPLHHLFIWNLLTVMIVMKLVNNHWDSAIYLVIFDAIEQSQEISSIQLRRRNCRRFTGINLIYGNTFS